MNARSIFAFGGQLAILVVLWTSSAAAAESTLSCTASAQDYWKIFRLAALRKDPDVVSELTWFPFEIRRILDDSKAEMIARKAFMKRFPSLLKVDPGLTSAPTTMKSFFTANERLSQAFCNPEGNQFRVGMWVFQLKRIGWRFVQASVDD